MIFWFTLFHEIAHFLNGDGKQKFIDFESVPGASEAKADSFARNQLITIKNMQRSLQKTTSRCRQSINLQNSKKFFPAS